MKYVIFIQTLLKSNIYRELVTIGSSRHSTAEYGPLNPILVLIPMDPGYGFAGVRSIGGIGGLDGLNPLVVSRPDNV